MFGFISIIFPAFIAGYIEWKRIKIRKIIELLYYYIIYNLFINGIVLLTVLIVNKFDITVITFTPLFTIEYIIMASILALILPKLKEHIKNNISISIKRKEKRNDHEKKKKSN